MIKKRDILKFMKTKINKKPLYPILILLLTMFFPLSVYSHSGRTDSDGGHYDKNNDSGLGSYHYHHGYPAHLHTDGICIYSFEDNTDHSSGSSTSNSNHNNTEIYSTEPIINEISVPEKNKDYFIYENLYIIVFGTVFLFLLIAISAGYISKWLSKSYFNDFFIWNTWYERKNIDSKLSNIQSMINNYQQNLINSEKYSADILALKQKNNDILKKIPQSIPLDKKGVL